MSPSLSPTPSTISPIASGVMPVFDEGMARAIWRRVPILSGVRIAIGAVPRTLSAPTARGVLWQAAPGRFLLDVPDVARYLVEGGQTIGIDRAMRATPVEINRFLQMAPLSALMNQRGLLTFHAAAVANSRGAILLAGDSGSGKSTLLEVFLNRGWTMLADDLSAVDADAAGTPWVLPTNVEIEASHHTGPQVQISSRPLYAIFWLTLHNRDAVELTEVEGISRFRAVGSVAYNSHIADVLLDRRLYMRHAAIITQSVPIYRLRRPRGRFSVEEIADRVELACH